uniref:CSON009586 protein n=1 Tax=Culicoides sonorensis TaxID=179676 RepID=A0A336KKH3_CULSO
MYIRTVDWILFFIVAIFIIVWYSCFRREVPTPHTIITMPPSSGNISSDMGPLSNITRLPTRTFGVIGIATVFSLNLTFTIDIQAVIGIKIRRERIARRKISIRSKLIELTLNSTLPSTTMNTTWKLTV